MPGRKNPMPADESAARRAKLAELERACEQLLEEEREAAARREHEATERRRREAAERREREIAEARDRGRQQDRRPRSEARGSQARRRSASPGVSQSGGPVQSSRCVNLQFRIQEHGGIGQHLWILPIVRHASSASTRTRAAAPAIRTRGSWHASAVHGARCTAHTLAASWQIRPPPISRRGRRWSAMVQK